MFEMTFETQIIAISVLDADLRLVLDGTFAGISTEGDLVRMIWVSEPDQATKDAVSAAVAAHDPAVLSADKARIAGDGVDTVTVEAWLPHTLVSSVVFLIEGVETAAKDLSDKRASIVLDAADVADGSLTIGIKDHAHETLEIEVVS